MIQFLIRRLFLVLPVLVGILLVTFIITRLVPGDPCYVMLGEQATEETCNEFKARFGLDKSIPEQFVRYVVNLAPGRFWQFTQRPPAHHDHHRRTPAHDH